MSIVGEPLSDNMRKNGILIAAGLIACIALPIGFHLTKEGGLDFFYRVIDGENGTTKIIYVDGGGDIHNFNTVTAGDYQCRQLETLCNEWSNAHPGYKAVVNKYSNNGSRDTLITQLSSRTAPHIIYQNGSVANNDINFDYYVHLNKYLDMENPYFLDEFGVARKWREVYNENELASTQASNGEYYYVNLEKQPVCLLYNKSILSASGVNNPENIKTFEELMNAFDKVKAYRNSHSNIDVYNTQYQWYSIAMESSLYSHLIDIGDVIGAPNHKISTEELCRLYYREEYKFDDRFKEYISLIKRINSYKSPSDNPNTAWFAGNLAFMEATGLQLSLVSKNKSFTNWGIIPYPAITTDTYDGAGKPCVRGIAGTATSYWVTRRADKDGTTDACVDLLMYLTAPEQNNRLINELGVGIPLNPTNKEDLPSYLLPLVEAYEQDIEEYSKGNMVGFDAFNSWGMMSTLYNNQFLITTKNLGNISSSGISVESAVNSLKNNFATEYQTMININRYDPSTW